MLRSLFSGISGLRAHQQMMDITGNNIANVNTAGFKSSNTVFQDTLSQLIKGAGASQGGNGRGEQGQRGDASARHTATAPTRNTRDGGRALDLTV